MRKVLLALTLITLLAGCTKNNDLVGTKWMTTGYSSYMSILIGGTWYKWYEFTTNDELYCFWTDANGNVIRSEGDYRYEYDYPSLTVHEDSSIESYQFADKRSFSLIRIDGSINKSVTYYKQ